MNLTVQTKALQKALAKSALLPDINTSDGISHLVHIYRQSSQVLFERASVAGKLTVNHPDPSETLLDVWLPFERFMRVCESLSGDTVTLAADEKQVLIKSAGSNAKLCVLPAGFMPSVGESDGPDFTLPSEVFADHLSAVLPAFATTGQKREMIEGMLFQPYLGNTYLCGLDGRRSHCVEVARGVVFTAYLPKRASSAILALSRLCGKDEDVGIRSGERWLDAQIGSARFLTPLLEGHVPNIMESYAKKETSPVVEFDRKEMLEATNALQCLESEYCILTIGEDKIGISSQKDNDHFERIVECTNGKPRKIKTNTKYLTDLMRSLRGERVIMQTEDGDFTSKFVEADRMSVVMNVRLSETK